MEVRKEWGNKSGIISISLWGGGGLKQAQNTAEKSIKRVTTGDRRFS